MRRVFPVRQADNGSSFAAVADSLGRRFSEDVQDPIKRVEEHMYAIGVSPKVSKLPNSCDSSIISGDENLNNINSIEVMVSRPPSHQKPPRASAYPIFTAGASHRQTSSLPSVSGKQKSSMEKQCAASRSSNLSDHSPKTSLNETLPIKPRSQTERPTSAPKNRPLSDNTGSQKYSLRSRSLRHTLLPDNFAVVNGMDEAVVPSRQLRSVPSHSRSFSLSTSEASFSECSERSSCFTKDTQSSGSFTSKKSSAGERTGMGSAPFKYLSARMVAEKLVKVLGKEKFKSHPNRPIGSELPQTMMGESSSASSTELKVHIERENAKPDLCFERSLFGSPHESDAHAADHMRVAPFMVDKATKRNIKQSNRYNLEPDFQSSLETRALEREKLALSLEKESTLCDANFRSLCTDNIVVEASTLDINKCKQEIRRLCREKRDLALEVAHEIRARISEQIMAADRLREVKMETDAKLLAMEKEKERMQETLEEELEIRRNEWTDNLEKMKCELQKSQERANRLLEDKTKLERVVSSFEEKEAAWREESAHFEGLLSGLRDRLATNDVDMERQMQAYAGTLEKLKAAENEVETLTQRDAVLQMENSELQNELTRLGRVCNDQEMTIEGLLEELDETVNSSFDCRSESLLRLQRELLRLAGVEQDLRSEVNAMHAELKSKEDKYAASADSPADLVKLNQELQDMIDNLQSKAFILQEENKQLTLSLRATIRAQRDAERTVKLFQLKGRTEDLENLSLSEEKGDGIGQKIKMCEGLEFPKNNVLEENPSILTSKLQFRESELKRLDEEYLEIVHSKESLQMEVDDLHGRLLMTNHHNRELEREIGRKEAAIEVLQADADRLCKELANLQSDLSRIRRQRNEMQKEAEDMSREALRLAKELNESKKTTEKLEEELMLKEGQISILQGTYRTCDCLA